MAAERSALFIATLRAKAAELGTEPAATLEQPAPYEESPVFPSAFYLPALKAMMASPGCLVAAFPLCAFQPEDPKVGK